MLYSDAFNIISFTMFLFNRINIFSFKCSLYTRDLVSIIHLFVHHILHCCPLSTFVNLFSGPKLIDLLCFLIHYPLIIPILSLYFPKKVIQWHLYHHLFYHVLKPDCQSMFTKHPFYRWKNSFISNLSASILSALLPF